jgi:ribonucleoside-triphosphate reductase
MYFKTTYDQEFDDLYMHLKAKYPQKLFDLEGIGKQMDMSEFSKNFFSSKVTSDASIDANSNVDDISIITYNIELPKPFFKINSYYILWKELKKLYSLEIANNIVEMQLTGDIYIHDFHGFAAALPYSYYGKSSIIIKNNDKTEYTTMQELFEDMSKNNSINSFGTYDEIILKNILILDNNNAWTYLKRILRHKSNTNLIQIETKRGYCTTVTTDHPVILNNNLTKNANNISLFDELMLSNSTIPLLETKTIDNDYAYFVGFLIGDGWMCKSKGKQIDIRSGKFYISQKNIKSTKIFSIIKRLFDNVVILQKDKISFGYKKDIEKLLDTGFGSLNRKLPKDILQWNKDAIKNLIAGIIDSDGNINSRNGICTIRTISFEMIQQLGELFRALNIGKIRTSFAGKYSSISGYKSNYEIYRITCRIEDKDFIDLSEKINENRNLVYKEMKGIDGRFDSNLIHKLISWETPEYVYDITTESGHFHCQGLIQHNCFNYSTYDILVKGLPMVRKIKSVPPKYLHAFKSQLEQFVIIASNSTLGATGLADLLIVLSYFAKNIIKTKSDAHYNFLEEKDCWSYIKEMLTSFIYSVNFALRANQSPFSNVSIFDKYFLKKMSEDYIFPDGSYPDIEIINKLQEIYIDIINKELERTPITFPITTACFTIDDENNILDENFLSFVSEKNKKYGFINIYCGKSSTLSSCCRLRSNNESEYFNSFGSGSSKIGSLGVCTINLPRLAIKAKKDKSLLLSNLIENVSVCSKINNAKRKVIEKRIKNNNEPLYTFEFMDLNRQYSTVGLNGINECIELMGENILEDNGQKLLLDIINSINTENKKLEKQYNTPHNVEQVPGENMSIKIAEKDKLLGYQNKYNIYSNQFIPLTTNADLLDRIYLQGLFDKHFTGGAICHINIDTKIEDTNQIKELIRTTAKMGVIYHAINYNLQECENGHMTVGKYDFCSICNSEIINNYSRVVGFLTNTKNWHKTRREEDYPNRQWYQNIII